MTITKTTTATMLSILVSIAHAEDKFVKCVFYDSQTQNKEHAVTEAGWLMKNGKASSIPSYTSARFSNIAGQRNLDQITFQSPRDLNVTLKYEADKNDYRMLIAGEIPAVFKPQISTSAYTELKSETIDNSSAEQAKPIAIANGPAPQPMFKDKTLESVRCITTTITPPATEQARQDNAYPAVPAPSTQNQEEKKSQPV